LKRILPLFSVLFFTFLISCNGIPENNTFVENSNLPAIAVHQTSQVVSLSTEEWAEQMQKNPGPIIDIRTPVEWKEGYIAEAKFADIFDEDFINQVNYIQENKNDPIYIYCRSGNRSKQAMTVLQEDGFAQIFELNNGILDWIEKGNKTIK
jgi:rhodanese-related sulfurtransferase